MTQRHTRRLATAVAGAALIALTSAPAGATSSVTTVRLQGPDRFATAAAIARATFPGGPANGTALVASGLNYPDALSASYLAGRLGAPVLLTLPTSVPAATTDALAALSVTTVDILGGVNAVSDQVVATLQADGYRVARIFGPDRYGTAATIASEFPSSSIGTYNNGGPTAVIATGTGFADALAAGPIAYHSALPILLSDPSALPPATQSALSTLGIAQVVVVGGPAAISDAVANQISAMHINVVRIAGADRTETATKLADAEIAQLGFGNVRVNLARSDNYPDALAGAPHAGVLAAPIVLAATPDLLGGSTTSWLQAHHSTLGAIDAFGGTLAISDATLAAAKSAAT